LLIWFDSRLGLTQLNEDCKKGFDVTAKIAGITTSKDSQAITLEVNEKPILILGKSPSGHPKYIVLDSKANL
jgi:hypothetical protein